MLKGVSLYSFFTDFVYGGGMIRKIADWPIKLNIITTIITIMTTTIIIMIAKQLSKKILAMR